MASAPDKTSALPLSRDLILQTAIQLADDHGIEALSMRKLAQQLGVKAMSLYNHVANKDDLIDGMVDIVAGEIEVPAVGGDWKQAMRQRAISAHQVLLRHPWATMEMVSRANVGPAMLRYVNATLGCLVEAGFSFEMADHVWNALDSHIYGFTLQKLNFPFEETEYADAAKQYVSMLPVKTYPYLNKLTHYVIDGQYHGIHDFEFGLDLIFNSLDSFRKASDSLA
ncbi:MAG: TetR/AcrR family transcriptional regulator C-terminal domain-containing protein [Leptolyngbyaceae cyanobacterium MAG.088]|nr:TetR/AcrR family transcriptional regulator C-terminal domain-containing protein [Leptolyngbyaceae cyanobacterium MAG.088]